MTEDEMVGWHHRLNGHEFGWTLGVGDGQGGLACCGPWGTELVTETRVCNKKFTHIYTQSVCFFLQFPHLKDKPHVTNLEGMNLFRASSSKSNLIGPKAKGIP